MYHKNHSINWMLFSHCFHEFCRFELAQIGSLSWNSIVSRSTSFARSLLFHSYIFAWSIHMLNTLFLSRLTFERDVILISVFPDRHLSIATDQNTFWFAHLFTSFVRLFAIAALCTLILFFLLTLSLHFAVPFTSISSHNIIRSCNSNSNLLYFSLLCVVVQIKLFLHPF